MQTTQTETSSTRIYRSASRSLLLIPAASLLLFSGCQQSKPTQPATTQQSSASGYNFSQGYPTAEAAKQAIDDTDFQRAIQAYRFWYPTVSAEGIFQGGRDIGLADNVKANKGAAGPRQIGFTLNSDTPYGSATIDLSQGPWVIEVPPGPFIGLADDHNQGWIADVGLPGPNAGKGDKLLMLPPGYKGATPAGYQLGHSETNKVLIAVRALPVNGDQAAALANLSNIKIYPLNSKDKAIVWVDTSAQKMDSSSLRWEDNMQFWTVLKKIIDEEPVSPRYPPCTRCSLPLASRKASPSSLISA